jgi:hypothetical protein
LHVESSASEYNSSKINNISSTGYGAYFKGGGNTTTRYLLKVADYTAGQKLLLDGAGNMGLGTIPSDTHAAFDTLEFNTASITSQSTATAGNLVLGSNMNYSSAGGPEYKITAEATQITQVSGIITLGVAASGAANTGITFNTGLEVLNDGKARAKNGLLFGTDTASANALDDYEEGTWTMFFATTGTAFTTSGQTGTSSYYIKIGKQVTVWGTGWITTPSGSSGDFQLTGLPFACNQTGGAAATQDIRFGRVTLEADKVPFGIIYNTSSTLSMEYNTSAGNATAMPSSALHNATPYIDFTATYQTT